MTPTPHKPQRAIEPDRFAEPDPPKRSKRRNTIPIQCEVCGDARQVKDKPRCTTHALALPYAARVLELEGTRQIEIRKIENALLIGGRAIAYVRVEGVIYQAAKTSLAAHGSLNAQQLGAETCVPEHVARVLAAKLIAQGYAKNTKSGAFQALAKLREENDRA